MARIIRPKDIREIKPVRALNKTETLASVRARTGADIIVNGGYYTMANGDPQSWLVIDGKTLATQYNGFGYAANKDKVVYSYQNNVSYPHFIGAVFRLIQDGEIAMIGGETNRRGRTAMGLTRSSEPIFYVARDDVAADKLTSRQLAEKMASLECVNAIELDGGVSSQYYDLGAQHSTGRPVSWWICIWVSQSPALQDPVAVVMPVLGFKSQNSYVGRLQSILGIFVDNSFGPDTLKAVQDFQRNHGLEVDGSVGPATWKVLLEVEARKTAVPTVKICPTCGQEVK